MHKTAVAMSTRLYTPEQARSALRYRRIALALAFVAAACATAIALLELLRHLGT